MEVGHLCGRCNAIFPLFERQLPSDWQTNREWWSDQEDGVARCLRCCALRCKEVGRTKHACGRLQPVKRIRYFGLLNELKRKSKNLAFAQARYAPGWDLAQAPWFNSEMARHVVARYLGLDHSEVDAAVFWSKVEPLFVGTDGLQPFKKKPYTVDYFGVKCAAPLSLLRARIHFTPQPSSTLPTRAQVSWHAAAGCREATEHRCFGAR